MVFKFENLKIWKIAREFASEIYEITRNFPKDELFGLTSQLRRAAVSVVLNIAEGSNRKSDLEFKRFLNIARSSLDEVITGLFIANDQKFIDKNTLNKLYTQADSLASKITALTNKLKN